MIGAVTDALRAELDAMAGDLELQMLLLAGRVGTRARNRLTGAADVPLLEAGWSRLMPMIVQTVTVGTTRRPQRLVHSTRRDDLTIYLEHVTPGELAVVLYRWQDSRSMIQQDTAVLQVDQAIWEAL